MANYADQITRLEKNANELRERIKTKGDYLDRVALEALEKQILALQKKQAKTQARTMQTRDGVTVKVGDTVYKAYLSEFHDFDHIDPAAPRRRAWHETEEPTETRLDVALANPVRFSNATIAAISPDGKSFSQSARHRASYTEFASGWFATKQAALADLVTSKEREFAWDQKLLDANFQVLDAAKGLLESEKVEVQA
jgi:hypothetical protein